VNGKMAKTKEKREKIIEKGDVNGNGLIPPAAG
jgi:hypothetical protein